MTRKLAAMPRLGAAWAAGAHSCLGSAAGPLGAGGGEVDRKGRGCYVLYVGV